MDDLLNFLQAPFSVGERTHLAERYRFPLVLRKAWYGLNQAFRRRIAHLGLTPDQYTALRTLDEVKRHGLTQKQLTLRMSSDPNTVASLLERMERAGLVRRDVDASDRRARRIILLPEGLKRYQQARLMAAALQSEVLQALPAEQIESFMEAFVGIAEACREAAEKSPKKSR
jgi:MarR family transcriptional regulator, transcriptional regulator for hemolysin